MTASESVVAWMTGQLSNSGRVWTALAPAIAMLGYFVIGLIIYAIRSKWRGRFRDAELEARDRTILTGLWIRQYFAWVMQPLWAFVVRTGIPPTAMTTLSLLLALGSGVSCAAGRFALGGWLYIFAGICDYFDGRLARQMGQASERGAALDSILDRYSDAAVLMGLAWFYRDSWILFAVLCALAGSFLVPYIRAKGEITGLKITTGIMPRAERILYLGAAVALSPILEVWLVPNDPRPIHRLAVVGVVLLAASTQITAVQRLVYLLGALNPGGTDGGSAAAADAKADSGPCTRVILTRNVVAAVAATLVDFGLVMLLVTGGMPAPLATAVGCGLGAVCNFMLNRMWTFGSRDPKVPQAWRYSFVSISSALLNSGGVAVLLMLPTVDYRIAWLLVRGAVFLAWNFPLQRDYVFAPPRPRTV